MSTGPDSQWAANKSSKVQHEINLNFIESVGHNVPYKFPHHHVEWTPHVERRANVLTEFYK